MNVREVEGNQALERIGGAAVLVAISIHMVGNWVLKEFPSPSLTGAELETYFSEQYLSWAIVHGARAVAVVGTALFAAALFVRCWRRWQAASVVGWGIVGLLGTAMLATSLMITNGLETLAYLNIELLRENQELFWLLRNVTRTLFSTEMAAWVLVFLGFSVAGWKSVAMPGWLSVLGVGSAVGALLCSIFITNILTNGSVAIAAPITGFAGMIWFASLGVLMLVKR